MSLYPSFEELTVGKEIEAQNHLAQAVISGAATGSSNYAQLARNFLGIDLANIAYDEYGNAIVPTSTVSGAVVMAPVSAVVPVSTNATLACRDPIDVSQGIKQLNLCKNAKGYVGIQLRDEDKGVFVTYVEAGSPAALAGLRFGDQVLQIRDQLVAGYSSKKAMNLISSAPKNNIRIVIRDRPLERCVTLQKNSLGQVGIMIKDGKVDSIVKDSSAARNGVLIHHYIVEINGVNVLGLKDKEISELLQTSPPAVKLTLMPEFFYNHLTKKLGSQYLKSMDRSQPIA